MVQPSISRHLRMHSTFSFVQGRCDPSSQFLVGAESQHKKREVGVWRHFGPCITRSHCGGHSGYRIATRPNATACSSFSYNSEASRSYMNIRCPKFPVVHKDHAMQKSSNAFKRPSDPTRRSLCLLHPNHLVIYIVWSGGKGSSQIRSVACALLRL